MIFSIFLNLNIYLTMRWHSTHCEVCELKPVIPAIHTANNPHFPVLYTLMTPILYTLMSHVLYTLMPPVLYTSMFTCPLHKCVFLTFYVFTYPFICLYGKTCFATCSLSLWLYAAWTQGNFMQLTFLNPQYKLSDALKTVGNCMRL